MARVLEELVEIRGVPGVIKSDNAPELLCDRVQDWITARGIGTQFIEPGSPGRNGHNESFRCVFRHGGLNPGLFVLIREARLVVERWRQECNDECPHGSLGQLAPAV